MKPVIKDILRFLIIGLILGLFAFWIASCSPEKRALRKISKIEKRFPHLFKHDTIFQERIIIERVPLKVHSDSVAFDSLLIEHETIRGILHQMEHESLRGEETQSQLEELRNRFALTKQALRKGAYVKTEGTFVSEDSTLSFNWIYDPTQSDPFQITKIKGKDRIINKTIKELITTKDAFVKIWWVWPLAFTILAALLFYLKK